MIYTNIEISIFDRGKMMFKRIKDIFMNWYLWNNISFQETPLSIYHPPSNEKLEKINISIDELIKDIKLKITKIKGSTNSLKFIEGSSLGLDDYVKEKSEKPCDINIKKITMDTLRIPFYLSESLLKDSLVPMKTIMISTIKWGIAHGIKEKGWTNSFISDNIQRTINMQEIYYWTKPRLYLNKLRHLLKLSIKLPKKIDHRILVTYYLRLGGY
jgi:hypothetical protein